MKLTFENLSHYLPDNTSGDFDIPILPRLFTRENEVEYVGFNYAMTCPETKGKCVHFFLDDSQFLRVWNQPDRYIDRLKRFESVFAPDFSLYSDMPRALQIYNHYRKHWVAAYWAELGIRVVPTISWSDESSFSWCFDGEPTESVLAISTVGTQGNKDTKRAFLRGFEEMCNRLRPSQILVYGKIPSEIESQSTPIGCFYDKFSRKGK